MYLRRCKRVQADQDGPRKLPKRVKTEEVKVLGVEEIEDDLNNEKSALLHDLPCELRIKIYKYVENSDILQLRLVNTQIKGEIDESLGFHVKIDESYRSYKRLCQRRVHSMVVTNLNRTTKSKAPFLRYPDRLKRLTFDGKVSKTNIQKLLTESSKSLQYLHFTHETLRYKKLFLSEKLRSTFAYNMIHLTSINLQYLRYPLGDPFQDESNIVSFLDFTFPSLRIFKLCYSTWGNWTRLFHFLQKHSPTLKDLELQVGDRNDALNTEIYLRRNPHRRLLDEIDFSALRKLQLTAFRFRDDVLHLNPTVQSIILDNIVRAQTQLQVFHFFSQNNFTIELLQDLCRINEKTLTEISIYNLRNITSDPVEAIILQQLHYQQSLTLDLKIFEKCTQLKKFALACSSSINHNPNANNFSSNPIKIINLHCLPSGLELINLTGFLLRFEELVRLSKEVRDLNELVIVDAGSMKYSAMLQSFLRNCGKLKYLSVRPILPLCHNEKAWYREIEALSKLYQQYMSTKFDPIDDLDGFEAFLKD